MWAALWCLLWWCCWAAARPTPEIQKEKPTPQAMTIWAEHGSQEDEDDEDEAPEPDEDMTSEDGNKEDQHELSVNNCRETKRSPPQGRWAA